LNTGRKYAPGTEGCPERLDMEIHVEIEGKAKYPTHSRFGQL
jgi:hypothetical protein